MMKKLTLGLIFIFLFVSISFAQESTEKKSQVSGVSVSKVPLSQAPGIKFTKKSWDKIRKQARKENKIIFVDCHTSWCAPCKKLSQQVFIQRDAGKLFNENFVNFKIDMEKGEGPALRAKFGVNAFPTLLWVYAKENIIHRVTGFMHEKKLIAEAQKAINGEGLQAVEKKYKKGATSKETRKEYVKMLAAGHDARAEEEITKYLNSLPEEQLLEEENYRMFKASVTDINASAFKYFESYLDKFAAKYGRNMVEMDIYSKYMTNCMNIARESAKKGKFDETAFKRLADIMEERNVQDRKKIQDISRVEYYKLSEDWKSYVNTIKEQIKMGYYGKNITMGYYNLWVNPLMGINCKDQYAIKQGVDWLQKGFENTPNSDPNFLKGILDGKLILLKKLDGAEDEIRDTEIMRDLLMDIHKKKMAYEKSIGNRSK